MKKVLFILSILLFSCETKMETEQIDKNIQRIGSIQLMSIYKIKVDTIDYIILYGDKSCAIIKHK